jgi:hypothetical protein
MALISSPSLRVEGSGVVEGHRQVPVDVPGRRGVVGVLGVGDAVHGVGRRVGRVEVGVGVADRAPAVRDVAERLHEVGDRTRLFARSLTPADG